MDGLKVDSRKPGPLMVLRNARKTGAVSSAPPECVREFLIVWRRAAAPFALLLAVAAVAFAHPQAPQNGALNPLPPEILNLPPETPVQFDSRGMEYDALTHEGITVMFAHLPPHIKDFSILQVTVTNGSLVSWTVKPSDFTFVRQDGTVLPSLSADYVVESLLVKASRTDVIKLQNLYENTIYALQNFRSTNGYEQRREAAQAQFVNRSIKAAAAASAITFVPTKLRSGDSTDGAVFFPNRGKEKGLGAGRLVVRTCGQIFLFQLYAELKEHK